MSKERLVELLSSAKEPSVAQIREMQDLLGARKSTGNFAAFTARKTVEFLKENPELLAKAAPWLIRTLEENGQGKALRQIVEANPEVKRTLVLQAGALVGGAPTEQLAIKELRKLSDADVEAFQAKTRLAGLSTSKIDGEDGRRTAAAARNLTAAIRNDETIIARRAPKTESEPVTVTAAPAEAPAPELQQELPKGPQPVLSQIEPASLAIPALKAYEPTAPEALSRPTPAAAPKPVISPTPAAPVNIDIARIDLVDSEVAAVLDTAAAVRTAPTTAAVPPAPEKEKPAAVAQGPDRFPAAPAPQPAPVQQARIGVADEETIVRAKPRTPVSIALVDLPVINTDILDLLPRMENVAPKKEGDKPTRVFSVEEPESAPAKKSGSGREPTRSADVAPKAKRVITLDETIGADGPIILEMPLDREVRSGYGVRTHPVKGGKRNHDGLDIAAPVGTKIVAQVRSQVAFAGHAEGYGSTVILHHGQGVYSVYAHLSSTKVRTGDVVEAGTPFARTGKAGTGPHLHYEVLLTAKDGSAYTIDPQDALGKNLGDAKVRGELIAAAVDEKQNDKRIARQMIKGQDGFCSAVFNNRVHDTFVVAHESTAPVDVAALAAEREAKIAAEKAAKAAEKEAEREARVLAARSHVRTLDKGNVKDGQGDYVASNSPRPQPEFKNAAQKAAYELHVKALAVHLHRGVTLSKDERMAKADAREMAEQIVGGVYDAGGNPDKIIPKMWLESRIVADASVRGGGKGLGQFTRETWLAELDRNKEEIKALYGYDVAEMKASEKLRLRSDDARLSVYMATKYDKSIAGGKSLAESYPLYFAGPNGGRMILTGNADVCAEDALTDVMPKNTFKLNRGIYADESGRKRTFGEVREELATRVAKAEKWYSALKAEVAPGSRIDIAARRDSDINVPKGSTAATFTAQAGGGMRKASFDPGEAEPGAGGYSRGGRDQNQPRPVLN